MITEHSDELTVADWRHAAYNFWLWGKRDDCFRFMNQAEGLYVHRSGCEGDGETPSFADVVYSDARLLESLGARKEDLKYLYDAYYRSRQK